MCSQVDGIVATRSGDIRPKGDGPTPGGVPVRRRNATHSKRAKSERTRERLCHATKQLIENRPLRQIKVSDIAAIALVSPATFYIYFADVEEAVLALLTERIENMPDLSARVEQISQGRVEQGVRAMLADYLGFWEDNYALLRIRNLAADEGEERFRASRSRMMTPLLDALAKKLIEFRPDQFDGETVQALAVAGVIVGSIERLASLIRVQPIRQQLSRECLIEAEIFLISKMLS